MVAATMSSDRMPVLTQEGVLAHLEGDRYLLWSVAHIFLEHLPRQVAEIRDALTQSDSPRLERAAHKLKGSVIALGAEEAYERAQVLETMGSHSDLADGDRAFAELEEVLVPLRTILEEVARQPEPTEP